MLENLPSDLLYLPDRPFTQSVKQPLLLAIERLPPLLPLMLDVAPGLFDRFVSPGLDIGTGFGEVVFAGRGEFFLELPVLVLLLLGGAVALFGGFDPPDDVRFPLFHRVDDGAVEESVQQRDEDQEVDHLCAERKPVDLHGFSTGRSLCGHDRAVTVNRPVGTTGTLPGSRTGWRK